MRSLILLFIKDQALCYNINLIAMHYFKRINRMQEDEIDEELPQHDVFQDVKNPIYSEEDEAFNIFKKMHVQALNKENLTLQTLFKSHKTITAQCGNILNSKEFYKCLDCQKHRFACICQECFMHGNHKGHRFEKKYAGYCEATCDCGNADIWQKKGFCKYHKGVGYKEEAEQMPTEIFKKDFVRLYERLFEMVFYNYQAHPKSRWTKKIHALIYQNLNELAKDSSYYLQAIYSLFERAKFRNQYDFLENTLRVYTKYFDDNVFEFFYKNLSNQKSIYLMLRKYIICCNKNQAFVRQGKSSDFLFQILAFRDTLKKLAEREKLIFMSPTPYSYVMDKYLSHLRSQTQEETDYYWREFVEQDGLKNHRFMIHSNDNLQKMIFSIQKDKKYFHLILKNILQNLCPQNIKIFFKMLVVYSQNNFEKYLNVHLFLQQQGIKIEDIEKIGKEFIKSLDKANQILIIGLIFINQYEKLRNSFYELAFEREPEEESSEQGQGLDKIIQTLNLSYTIIQSIIDKSSLLANLSLYCPEKYEQNYKIFIKQTICEVNKDISFFKAKFSDQQHILSKVVKSCRIDNSGYIIHNFEDTYEYPALRFLYKTKNLMKIGQEIKNLSNYQKQLINFIFNDEYQERLKEKIDQFISKIEEGQYYNLNKIQHNLCQILIFLDSVFKQQSIYIKEIINKVYDDKEFRRKIIPQQQNLKEKIYLSFHIEQDEQKNTETQQKQNEQKNARKKKLEQLKKKKLLKMKEKQQKVLQENPEEDKQQKEGEDICLLCHEKSSQGKGLFNYALLQNEQFIKQFIPETKNIFIDIKTCPHFIHQKCYLGQNGNFDEYIRCPYCKFLSNIILPATEWKGEQNSWESRLEIAYSIETGLQSIHSISLFIKYLVYSKGIKHLYFDSLNTRKKKYEEKIKLQKQIEDIIMKYEKEEKIKEQFDKIENEIEQNTLINNINYVTVKGLRHKFLKEPFKGTSVLKQIKENICEKEFEIILNNVEAMIQQKIEIPAFSEKKKKNSLFSKLDLKCNLPEEIGEFLNFKSPQCKKCNKYENNVWECIICGESSCEKCLKENEHAKKDHSGMCLFLQFVNAKIVMIKNKQTNYGSLYENDLQEEWTRYQKAEGYFLKAKRVELFLKAYQSNDIQLIKSESKIHLQYQYGYAEENDW